MNQKHLLKFIRKKLKTSSQDVVIKRDGEILTLAQVWRGGRLVCMQCHPVDRPSNPLLLGRCLPPWA